MDQCRSKSRLHLGGAVAVAAVAATVLYGVPATAAPARPGLAGAPTHHSTTFRAAQIAALSAGAKEPMIVLLRDQHSNLPGTPTTAAARSAAVRTDQRPLLAEVAATGGTKVAPFTLLNGFAASITGAEAAHLATNSAVRAVVRDLPIKRTDPSAAKGTAGGERSSAPRSTSVPPGACPSKPSQPILEPEALQLTHTAYSDRSIPQAQNYVDGTGVKVAYLAEGIDIHNPDFIRANGKPVFSDYRDFSGEGPNAPSPAAEAFGDASAIAAQGLHPYDLSRYVAPAHPLPKGCNIIIRGVAPGASLVGLKVFGEAPTAPSSRFVQAIDYAVLTDNVNVINESFGANPYPDNSTDPISLVDDAAVRAGVTVVASTGDAGTNGTIGSPGSDPNVIGAGATTGFRSYAQATYAGFQFSNGTWASDNTSSLSSGGVAGSGKVPDVVALGDLGWALCSPDPALYTGCVDFNGNGSSIQLFGGTSQAAPLTAGASALVIEAYAKTHGGAHPTPALVKQILTSSAIDLGLPAFEQGAGEINTLAAVKTAMSVPDSFGSPAPTGSGLLVSPTQLIATGKPGQLQNFDVTVRNVSPITQVLNAHVRSLSTVVRNTTGTVTLHATNPTKTFVDGLGIVKAYTSTTFSVPAGADNLAFRIAAPEKQVGGVNQSPVRVFLINPLGVYSAYSIPQGYAHYGSVDVRYPAAGTWTAYIDCNAGTYGYDGPVSYQALSTAYRTVGSVTPASLPVPPGRTGTLHVSVADGASVGDLSDALEIDSALMSRVAVPVTLRTMLPSGGSFTGTLTGGNGRAYSPAQSTYYYLDVPAGQRDLDVNLKLTDPTVVVNAYLVAPDGEPLSGGSNVQVVGGAARYTSTLQMYHAGPVAGRWKVLVVFGNPVSGLRISEPFSGIVAFNGASAIAPTLPTSPMKHLQAGHTYAVKVTVKNTGNAAAGFFTDPRRNTYATRTLAPKGQTTNVPLPVPADVTPTWLVPPETDTATFQASATLPIDLDVYYGSANSGEPEVYGASNGTTSRATAADAELASGLWVGTPSELGPFSGPAPAGTANLTATAHTKVFDATITSSTGDRWLESVNPTTPPTTPLTLQPGQSGTITVSITPSGAAGSYISGIIHIDTFSDFTATGDEVVGLPYAYTIG